MTGTPAPRPPAQRQQRPRVVKLACNHDILDFPSTTQTPTHEHPDARRPHTFAVIVELCHPCGEALQRAVPVRMWVFCRPLHLARARPKCSRPGASALHVATSCSVGATPNCATASAMHMRTPCNRHIPCVHEPTYTRTRICESTPGSLGQQIHVIEHKNDNKARSPQGNMPCLTSRWGGEAFRLSCRQAAVRTQIALGKRWDKQTQLLHNAAPPP